VVLPLTARAPQARPHAPEVHAPEVHAPEIHARVGRTPAAPACPAPPAALTDGALGGPSRFAAPTAADAAARARAADANAATVLTGLDAAIAAALETRTAAPLLDRLRRLEARGAAAERDLTAAGRPGEGAARLTAAGPRLAAHARGVAGGLPASAPERAALERLARRLDDAKVGGTSTTHRAGQPIALEQTQDRRVPSAALAELTQALQAQGVAHTIVDVPLEGGGSALGLRIEPGDEGLGKLAARVKARFGVELLYCPETLAQLGALGAYDPSTKQVFLDAETIRKGKPTATGLHELRHAYFDTLRDEGHGTPFDVTLHSRSRAPISRRSEIYRSYQSGEELATWTKDLRAAFGEVTTSDGTPRGAFPWKLHEKLTGTLQLTHQTQDAVGRAVGVIDGLLELEKPRHLRTQLAESRMVTVKDGVVCVDKLGWQAKVPFVRPEEKALLTRLDAAEQALAHVKKSGGFLAPLTHRKQLEAAKLELDGAQRAVLGHVKTRLQALGEHAAGVEAQVTPLATRTRVLALLRNAEYLGPDNRAALLDVAKTLPELTAHVEAWNAKPGDEAAWKALTADLYGRGFEALRTEGKGTVDRLAIGSTRVVHAARGEPKPLR
jgi:hypothetical protein